MHPPIHPPLQAFMFHTISLYGDAEGWNIAFYIFTACRSFLFFLVVILLATGGCLVLVGPLVAAMVFID
jgi:hypothetical protein